MAELAHYLWALASGSWALVSAVLFGGLDKVIEHTMPAVKAWLDRRLPAQRRRALLLWAIVLAVVYSGYVAFFDEHEARVSAERQSRQQGYLIADLRGKLASRPPVEKDTILREIHIPEKAPLARSLKRENIQVLQEVFGQDGAKAASMDQYHSTKATGVLLQFRNIGTDTVQWKLNSLRLRFPDGEVASPLDLKPLIVLAGDRSEVQYKLDKAVEIQRSFREVQVAASLEYDTIPATGKRRSLLKGIVPILWTPPQPNNNPVDAAGLMSFVVQSDKEK